LLTISTFAATIFFNPTDTFNPHNLCNPGPIFLHTKQQCRMSQSAISIHPDIQDGAPVFSGTRIRIETLYDFMRIGVSLNEFLDEFPSITRDQAMEVCDMMHRQGGSDPFGGQAGPKSSVQPGSGRMFAAA
jgi:uncharacterized protein (DUF433 family)